MWGVRNGRVIIDELTVTLNEMYNVVGAVMYLWSERVLETIESQAYYLRVDHIATEFLSAARWYGFSLRCLHRL